MKVKLLSILMVIVALVLCTSLFLAPMANAKKGATILDVTAAASQYGLKPGDSKYDATSVAKYDIDYDHTGAGKLGPDGPINMLDLVTLIYNYTGGR
jgi:hypothetical protein